MKDLGNAIFSELYHSFTTSLATGLRLAASLTLIATFDKSSNNLNAAPPEQAGIRTAEASEESKPPKQQPTDIQRMQGVWRVVASQVGDEVATADEIARRRVTITGDSFTYDDGSQNGEKRTGTLKLDPATHGLDLRDSFENATALAVYDLKDDTLRIGFGTDGLVRPKNWTIDEENIGWLLVLRRENSPSIWVADASREKYPDQAAIGLLKGKPFTVDLAHIAPWHEFSGTGGETPEIKDRVDGGVLTLQAGNDAQPQNYLTIFVVVPPRQTLEDKEFLVSAGGLFKQTQKIMDKDGKGWFYPVGGVQIQSGEPGQDQTELFPKVTMRLKFNKREDDRLPGKIYLCIDDEHKSVVAGSFNAVVKENGAALPGPKNESHGNAGSGDSEKELKNPTDKHKH